MKTNDLIDMMAQDNPAHTATGRSLPGIALAGVAASGALLAAFWGMRPDFSDVINQPLVLSKQLLPLLTALPCLLWVIRSQRPDYAFGKRLRWLAAPVLVVIALWLYSLSALPAAQWLSAIKGETLFACVLSIPLLAAPILAGLLWATRHGAPSSPRLAGALCGIAAGCLATSIYAFHCYEDNPAFYALWYSVAISVVGMVGQQLGARVLKW